MFESCVDRIFDSTPETRMPRVVGFSGLSFIIETPILMSAKEESLIVNAPDQHSIDVRQPFGKSQIRDGLRESSVEFKCRKLVVEFS